MGTNSKKKIALLSAALILIVSLSVIGYKQINSNSIDRPISKVETTEKTEKKIDKADKINNNDKDRANSEADKDSDSAKSAKSDKKNSSTKDKTWVPPVYKNVYHEEKGHYETHTYTVCLGKNCGARFKTKDAWYQHWQNYIASNGGV